MSLPAYVDATEAACTWVNEQTTLVGLGKPLSAGAHRDPQGSPSSGAVAHATSVSTTQDTSEAPITSVLVSFSVYALTDAASLRAAVALANHLATCDGDPVEVGDTVLLCVERITGPSRIPAAGGRSDNRYLVDALINVTPL